MHLSCDCQAQLTIVSLLVYISFLFARLLCPHVQRFTLWQLERIDMRNSREVRALMRVPQFSALCSHEVDMPFSRLSSAP